jgi:drug/metabolite transporter (DMT)-like permease
MYGAADFCGGLGTKRGSLLAVLVFSQLVGGVIAFAAALLLGDPLPGIMDLAWGSLAGACGAAGLAALYTAIASTPVAVASPVASVIGAALPVILGVLGGERPTAVHWIGIALALPAMALLTAGRLGPQERSAARRAAALGSLAGLGFGLFFFVISRTSHASGIWPLVAARVSTISLVALYAGVTRRSLRPGGPGFLFVLLSGVLDMGANIAFLLASRRGLLTTAAVVTSLYPGPTVLLALIVFRERLGVARAAGLLLALVGVALIAV